ncbi:MAG: sensor histidine kinase [Myxococcota bacterium]
MPPVAPILVAWSAVHFFVGLYALVLYLRLRPGPEYLGFAVAALGMVFYTAGAAWLLSATDLSTAVHAQRLQMLGMTIGLPGFVYLLLGLAGHPSTVVGFLGVAWGALGLLANLAGLFHDPAAPGHGPWAQPEASLLPAGLIFSYGAITITLSAFVQVVRSRGLRNHDLRLIVLLTVPAAGAWAYESVVHTMGLTAPLVLVHVGLLSSIGVSYVLLSRFVRLDDELRERTRELRRSYEELQLVQEELVRKEQLAAVGELSAVIANEVRSPLEALRSAVDDLDRDEVSATEQEHLLETLDEETDRLNRLVRDLLAYARPVEPQVELASLEELIRKAMPPDDRIPPAVQIDLDVGEAPEVVPCDPDLLGRALGHVIENSLQAMAAGGSLTIRGTHSLDHGVPMMSLSIHDTGEGMDQLVQEKARDPFFTTRSSGTGLGLAIVERVVQAHGGMVQLHSSYGHGTTVTLHLPLDRRSSTPPSPDDRLPADLFRR